MDTGNGAQALVAPFLLTKLGCKVIIINGNINGNFPGRGSEPTSDNLGVLTNMVRKMKADFGVAYDGDGDRAIFCDDKGTVHFGDKTGALLARHLLRTRHKGTEIVCPINTSMVLTWVVEEERSKVTYTKVGSVDVSREMIKRKAVIGLEENGGFMYGKLNQVRDGALATALILEMLAASKNKRLSDMISSLRNVFQYKSKFVCCTKQLANNIINLCLQHGSPKRVETIDGAKIWVDDETWIMIRPSGTEPIIRVYAESTDKLLLDSKVEEYQRLIINNLER
jgi:phosphomannomutase/phosphoglucomutase